MYKSKKDLVPHVGKYCLVKCPLNFFNGNNDQTEFLGRIISITNSYQLFDAKVKFFIQDRFHSFLYANEIIEILDDVPLLFKLLE